MGYNWVMDKKIPTVINGETSWKCSSCDDWHPENGFYKDKRTANGLKSQCKKCHSIGSINTRDKVNARKNNRNYMRRARKSDPEKFKKRERKSSRKRSKTKNQIARQKLNNAVRKGEILKPKKCEECDLSIRLTGHHEDYDKPLEVEWLCYECHGKRHWID